MTNITGLPEADKAKIKHLINEGVKITQEIDDLKGSLKDTVKAVAEELDIKASVLNRAIRAAYKHDIAQSREDLDGVEEVLVVAGKI